MTITYSKTSIKYLQRIEKKMSQNIVMGIEKLPVEGDIKKMKGQHLEDIYRLRIGKYRVLYFLEKETVKILKIDTRGDIYK
ncbi:MAG: type II toxin-antitoxin system RelE/ParE family toxin [Candidatus Aminicenantes bacterium]|nr:type II toxin-antitoxin system RelE/ParE family toxin [Candidatus Aminicenantes bacterium]